MINKERARAFIRQHKLICFAVGFVAAIVLIALTRTSEPSYQGKTASEWLEYSFHSGSSSAVRNAFNSMGKDAILPIAKELEADDSHFKDRMLRWLATKTGWNIAPAQAKTRRLEAMVWLEHLGLLEVDNLAHATPYLLKQLDHPDMEIRIEAADCVGLTRGYPDLVIPKMLDLLKSPEPKLRSCALNALARYPAAKSDVKPLLLSHLNDSNRMVFLNASYAVKELAPEELNTWLSPRVSQMLQSSNVGDQKFAIWALAWHHPADLANLDRVFTLMTNRNNGARSAAHSELTRLGMTGKLPVAMVERVIDATISDLEDDEQVTRTQACSFLQEWATRATNALPKLLELYLGSKAGNNYYDRGRLGNTILRISPSKAKELGIVYTEPHDP